MRIEERRLATLAAGTSGFGPAYQPPPLADTLPPGGQAFLYTPHTEPAQLLAASPEQLQLTTAWYHSILRFTPDGLLVMDRHGVIVHTNAQLETLFGYEERELIGSHIEMLLPAAIRNTHVKKPVDFVAHGRVEPSPLLRGRRKDATEFPVDISLSHLPDSAGRVGDMCAVIRDITERVCAEEALHAREQTFRALVENSPDAVLRFDLNGRHTYANPAVERITGIPAQALLGKTPIEVMVNDHSLAEKQLACVQQVLLTGAATEVELAWIRADGALQQLHVHFVPEHGPDGQVTSVLAMGRDISARKLTEERLRSSRDMVRALAAHQEAKHESQRKELAYKIHEDLAQNLAALNLNLSLLKRNDDGDPHAPILKTLQDLTERSITRIRDIVSILRPTALNLGLVPALQWLINDFKGFGFQFDQALQEDILISEEASTLLFRAAQEALLNIALHAAATRIHVALTAQADICRLVVRDNGCGFDSTLPRREGRFGFIRLTEQFQHLGGDLSIDSAPGQGTTLEFLLPCFAEDNSLQM